MASCSSRTARPARRALGAQRLEVGGARHGRDLSCETVRVARIVLGITGGIAAYKACEVVRLLVRAGHDVLPLPTRGAERFVA